MNAQEPFELESRALGALPIVGRFLERMRLAGLLERHLPPADARVALEPARAIGLLVRNLCVSHQPLYRLGEWGLPFEPALLGLSAEEVELLSDDQVGRALDRLFCADRASLLTELVLGAIASSRSTAPSFTTTRPRSPCTAPTAPPTGTSQPAARRPGSATVITRTTVPTSSNCCGS